MLSRALLATVLTLPALAACGGSGGDDRATGGGDAGTPAAGTTTSPATGGAPTAAPTASPQERLNAAADALASTSGFHLEGTTTDAKGPGELEGDIRADGSLRFVVRQDNWDLELRKIGERVYFKADNAFWQANGGGAAADVFAGRWVTGSAEQLGGDEFELFEPGTLAYCLRRPIRGLRDGGRGEVEGTAVTRIDDPGLEPGNSPGILSIAAEGKPFPLRLEQTGRSKPGGKLDPRCDVDDGKESTTTKEDMVLSDFGATSAIPAPKGAVSLDELQRQAGEQS